ncbi:hypothetical protein QFC21_005633 [Naganishia friedmannii]|uniref:Uncharacterized protein n=1 Tax=Naganishia friedmannii TaxID=89922 RepID=A0ACC2V9Q9_9TREE|nr:hypothetical protein QFC21_005633 [Naganishia friedmannii]
MHYRRLLFSLSPLPLATKRIPADLPTYDQVIDLAQLTEEVGTLEIPAVPYGGFAPFDVSGRMRKEASGLVDEWEGMKVDLERDLVVQMMTAHPTRFPLHLWEFDFSPDQHTENGRKAKSRRITIVMDAHDEDPDICGLAVLRPYGSPNRIGDETYYINPTASSPTPLSIIATNNGQPPLYRWKPGRFGRKVHRRRTRLSNASTRIWQSVPTSMAYALLAIS